MLDHKCYIHIGYGKTGTTYLQNYFRWIAQTNQITTLDYPLEISKQLPFEANYPGNGHFIAKAINNGNVEDAAKHLKNLIKNTGNSKLLISSEDFSITSTDGFVWLIGQLANFGYTSEFIVTVVPLFKTAYSFYLQSVSQLAQSQAFAEMPSGANFTLWVHFLRNFSGVDADLHVVTQPRENLVKKFFDIMDLPIFHLMEAPDVISNRSITRGELEALLIVNAVMKDSQLSQKISSHLKLLHPDRRASKMTYTEALATHANVKKLEKMYRRFRGGQVAKVVDELLYLPEKDEIKETDYSSDFNIEHFKETFEFSLNLCKRDAVRANNLEKSLAHQKHVVSNLERQLNRLKSKSDNKLLSVFRRPTD